MAEELKATNIEKIKGEDEFFEVEELIKETLKESQILEKEKASKAPVSESAPPTELHGTKLDPVQPAMESQPNLGQTKAKSAEQGYAATFKEYKVGDIVKGSVLKIDPSGVLVDIKYKADGLILPEELSDRSFTTPDEIVKVGEIIDVYIENLESKDGHIVLSKKRADYEKQWKTAYDAFKRKKLLVGKVIQVLRGGLAVDCDGIRGFIPASQVQRKAQEPLESFKDKTLPVKIIEINRRQGKIVLSHKLAAGEKNQQDTHKVFDELEVGQIRKGTVSSLKTFGAFVDLGGVEGLVHLSELSWKRVRHPSEVLRVGQETEVFVLGVDKINQKVSLGLKELQPDPWAEATDHFKPGQIIKVKVLRFATFGAFVELDHGLEGLVHISEISRAPIQKPEDVLKIGDIVEAKILRILPEEQRIGLSIKDAVAKREKEEIAKTTPAQEESKVTIGDMIAQKEKERAEREAEEMAEIPGEEEPT